METDCSYYFLTSTAVQIWKSNDTRGQEKMYSCLSVHYKKTYYSRVVFKNARITDYHLETLADEAFDEMWDSFRQRGSRNALLISSDNYPDYLFGMFKNIYLQMLAKEELKIKAGMIFMQNREEENPYDKRELNDDMVFSPRVQQVLNRLSSNCRELITWRYVEKLDYDEIARRKVSVQRDSCIKMVSKCKDNFLIIWDSLSPKSE